jgi:hypothetical protein
MKVILYIKMNTKDCFNIANSLMQKNKCLPFERYTFVIKNNLIFNNQERQKIMNTTYNHNGYKRVQLYNNKNFEMVYFIWKPLGFIYPHTHTKEGCIMKVIEGSLNETTLTPTLKKISTKQHKKNEISFIRGTDVLHYLDNDTDKVCETLHLYKY